MPTYYDDNYGQWEDMADPDMVDFYFETQRQSVEKVCERCGRRVRIKPEYALCNSCATARENGMDY